MISDGKTVFEGEVAQLRAARGDELILRPESESSLAPLVALVQQERCSARVEGGGGGNATTTLARAVVVSAIYVTGVALFTTYTFRPRDVTA